VIFRRASFVLPGSRRLGEGMRMRKVASAAVLLSATAFLCIGLARAAGAQSASPTASAAAKTCADFKTQAEAQSYFNSKGGSKTNNVDNLDPNRNGIACEGLPGTPSASATPTPASTAAPAAGEIPFQATAANDTLTASSHGLSSGQSVTVTSRSGVALPAGLSSGGAYFVINPTTTTFQLATSSGGTAIDLTSDGGGLVKTRALGNTGIFSDIMAMSGLSLLEAGVALSLLSERIRSRGKRVPMLVLKRLAKASRQGRNEVELADDLYIVRKAPGAPRVAPPKRDEPARKTPRRPSVVFTPPIDNGSRANVAPVHDVGDEWTAAVTLDDAGRDEADWPYFTPPA
jgi:excalibur calcium-binding domain-containing protein